ncbi:MAG: redoxin domain-containing protein [Saprospirales bacterium]|nr:redoxin domain-containing protein [Saprospirales bacterium]
MTDVHGQTHHLYEYLEAGKVVVLDFFYTTCGPCQFYSPQVNLAYEKYGCNNVDVIFIAIDYGDTDAMVEAYDQEYEIEFPSISGEEGGGNGVVADYGVFAFPTFYVIDSTKKIIDEIDPPTLQVFDFRFEQHGIQPADCEATGVLEGNSAGDFQLYPNPVESELTIEGPEFCQVELFDLHGRLARSYELRTEKETFDLSGLAEGVYVVRVGDCLNQNSQNSRISRITSYLILKIF